jgi:glycosyltransferase involved in cell wall biosynthesis
MASFIIFHSYAYPLVYHPVGVKSAVKKISLVAAKLANKMKLLYVVSGQSYKSLRPSRKILALVQCWRDMGHEVELICGGDFGGSANGISATGGKAAKGRKQPWYRKSSLLGPIVDTISEVKNLRHDRRLAKLVEQRISNFKPDLYLQRSSRLDGKTLSVALKAGLPTVLEWKDQPIASDSARRALNREDFYGYSLLKCLVRRVEAWKEARADYLIVESEELKKRLSRAFDRKPEDFVVAHNAVHISDFDIDAALPTEEARSKLALPKDAFLPVFIGSFAWYQHVELLVEAVALDDPQLPPMTAVLLGDGPGRAAVERRTQELGVEDRVLFIGRVPHEGVPDYLATADAAILPDGTDIICPIKILEYMVMGVPPVLPDYEANREVVEHDVTGLLFEPGNAKALHDQLRRLQNDPELGRKIGMAARDRAKNQFSWEQTWGRAIEGIRERTK